jgi:hypothetical protein
MTHDVFISYSAKDQKIVEGLSAYLEQNGLRCWIAYRDIPAGKDWAEYIPPAIENCKMVVYVHSSSANVSQEINKEIALCLKMQHPIIPFRIQDIDYSNAKAYHLQTINWIDAFPSPEKHFGELVIKIQNLFPELKKEIRVENNRIEIENKKNEIKTDKGDIKLMKILTIIGIATVPFSAGLFGAFYIAHAIFALNKNMTVKAKAMGITMFGLICFPFLLFLSILILTHVNFWEALIATTFIVGPFGAVYSAIWIKKLNALARE